MKQILVDTSVIIDFLRVTDKEKTQFVSLLQQNYRGVISIVTHTELYAGKSVWERPKAQKELATIFDGLQVLPLDARISREAGRLKARHGMGLLDAIIAATAIVHKLSLVTSNVKDFQKIKGLQLF